MPQQNAHTAAHTDKPKSQRRERQVLQRVGALVTSTSLSTHAHLPSAAGKGHRVSAHVVTFECVGRDQRSYTANAKFVA